MLGAAIFIGIGFGIAILVGVLIACIGFCTLFPPISLSRWQKGTAKFAMAVWKSKVRSFIGAVLSVSQRFDFDYIDQTYHRRYENSVKSMNSSSRERELHRMDTDMSTKSVLGVFPQLFIGLVFTFWEFMFRSTY